MLDIKEGENLSKHTTFHIGGAAKYFAMVKNKEELEEALSFATEKNLKYFILGGGSNVLFSDAGFDGLVVRIAFMEIEIAGEEMIAGAGAPLFLAIKKSAEAGLAGMENFSGIPGTVGGAAVNNAGAYGKSIADIMEKAEILMPPSVISAEAGIQTFKTEVARNVVNAEPRRALGDSTGAERSTTVVDKSWFQYEYRASRLKFWTGEGKPGSETLADSHLAPPERRAKVLLPGKPILLKVWFRLAKGDKEAIEQRIREIVNSRAAKDPKGFSAGCAFKNIKGEAVKEFLEKNNFSPAEKNLFASRGAIPAAWFVERAELKGKKIGGAYVASEHANYIMNDGAAKADDVLMLLSYIKQQVRDKYGVQLEEEIEIVI